MPSDDSPFEVASRSTNRRGFLRSAGVAAIATTTLAGCAGNDGGTTGGGDDLADEVVFMTWGGDFAESIRTNYGETFEEEYGVSVEVVEASSGHEMRSRIEAGAQDVHVIHPEEIPGYMAAKDDLIQPIRPENVPNYDKIRDSFAPEDAVYDPGEDIHHIPHAIGGTGLVYNHDELEEPSSWKDIMTDDLEGKTTYFNYPNYVVGQAAIALGYDPNEAVEEGHMDEVWDMVRRRNDHVQQWSGSGSTIMEMLSNESVYAGSLWIGRVNELQENDVPVSYTIPDEGAYFWLDVLQIPHYVEDPVRETAELFISHLISEEGSAGFSKEQVYGIPIEYTEIEPPEIIEENADMQNLDKLKSWDPAIYEENVEDWEKKFQEISRS